MKHKSARPTAEYVHFIVDVLMWPNAVNTEDDKGDGEKEPKNNADTLICGQKQDEIGDAVTNVEFMILGQPNQRGALDVFNFLPAKRHCHTGTPRSKWK